MFALTEHLYVILAKTNVIYVAYDGVCCINIMNVKQTEQFQIYKTLVKTLVRLVIKYAV